MNNLPYSQGDQNSQCSHDEQTATKLTLNSASGIEAQSGDRIARDKVIRGDEVYGDVVHQDKVSGDKIINNYHTTVQTLLDTAADETETDFFWLTAGRSEDMAQLDAWFGAVLTDKAGDAPHTVIVSGGMGMGKREMVRKWCRNLRQQNGRVLVAHSTYLPPHYNEAEQETFYATNSQLQHAWAQHAVQLRSCYSYAEALGGRGWLALATQIVAQSAFARNSLRDLPLIPEQPTESIVHRHMSELLVNAIGDGPLVIVIDHVEYAPTTLQPLLNQWNKVLYNEPFFLILLVDRPFPLHSSLPEDHEQAWLTWLRTVSAPHNQYSFPTLHIGPLRRHDIGQLLSDASVDYADELHQLTSGSPELLYELLRYWQKQGMAQQQPDQRWKLNRATFERLPGTLYQYYIEEPLRDAAARAQAMGYDFTWEILLDWLSYAVWEGESFTGEALARAIDVHGEYQEAIQKILNGALIRDTRGTTASGLLMKLDETVKLPTADPQQREKDLTYYRFEPLLLARVLLQRQRPQEQQQRTGRYLQALIDTYQPFERLVAPILVRLAEIANQDADRFKQMMISPQQVEQVQLTLAVLRTIAVDRSGQQSFIQAVLSFWRDLYLTTHPSIFLPFLEEALNYARSLQDISQQSRLLNNIGKVYADLGDLKQALEFLQQALSLQHNSENLRDCGTTLRHIGVIYSILDDIEQALDFLQQALSFSQQSNDTEGEAATLTNLGAIYLKVDEPERAHTYLQQARALQHQLGDTRGLAYTYTNLARVHLSFDHQQAISFCQQALSFARGLDDIRSEANTLAYMGLIYSEQGNNRQGLNSYQRALSLERKVGSIYTEISILGEIAHLYSGSGDYKQALDFNKQALPLIRKINDTKREAIAFLNIGHAYKSLDDNQQALKYYRQAINIKRQLGDIHGEADTLEHIGSIYKALGDHQRVLDVYQQILELKQKAGDIPGKAHTLMFIAVVYLYLDDFQKAFPFYQQALPLLRQTNNSRGEAITLTGMAHIYSRLNDKQQARDHFEAALPIWEKLDPSEAAKVRDWLTTLG